MLVCEDKAPGEKSRSKYATIQSGRAGIGECAQLVAVEQINEATATTFIIMAFATQCQFAACPESRNAA
jgi:hypothetical protein